MAEHLQQGRIVWARMYDPKKQNPKCRTGVVITRTGEIKNNDPFVVVACTSTFAEPLEPDAVALPWNNDPKRVRTRLRRPVVAKCNWLISLRKSDVEDYAGVVPPTVLNEILIRVNRVVRQGGPSN